MLCLQISIAYLLRIFYTAFSYEFLCVLYNFLCLFRPYFNTNFLLFLLRFFRWTLHCIFVWLSLCFSIQICVLYELLHWLFLTNFLLSLQQIRFYMLYPWKQWIWLYYLNFNAIPILQCLWLSSLLADLCFHWKLFCYFHQLLSYVFSLSNRFCATTTKFVGEVPWNSASCSFICTCNIKTPFCCFADLPLLGFSLYFLYYALCWLAVFAVL